MKQFCIEAVIYNSNESVKITSCCCYTMVGRAQN